MLSLVDRIKELKRKRNAVILAHNYQLPEVQDIADFVGDSLGLSMKAAKTDAAVIVFCGVYFMAETAKILSPKKTVLIPDKTACCPMARMINVDELKKIKKKHPNTKVLGYVNTSAAVKAECDICCTSANAVKVVERVFKNENEIIFVPDKYLANYVKTRTGKKIISCEAFCPTHIKIIEKDILAKKKTYPKAEVLGHPECIPTVLGHCDKVLSTGGMIEYVKASSTREFIIATEIGVIYAMKKENPDKFFYFASELAVCPNMKTITLEKIVFALEGMRFEVNIEKELANEAKKSIEKMLKLV